VPEAAGPVTGGISIAPALDWPTGDGWRIMAEAPEKLNAKQKAYLEKVARQLGSESITPEAHRERLSQPAVFSAETAKARQLLIDAADDSGTL
jgi:hypothetical protein